MKKLTVQKTTNSFKIKLNALSRKELKNLNGGDESGKLLPTNRCHASTVCSSGYAMEVPFLPTPQVQCC